MTGRPKELIRDAAQDLFPTKGYAATSVREIADRAGVDPTLVIRHFGSKEQLFLETVAFGEGFSDFLNGPLASLGVRAASVVVDLRDELTAEDSVVGAFAAMVRASDRPAVRAALERAVDTVFVEPLLPRMRGRSVGLRARLIATQISGLMFQLYVVRDAELLAADRATLVRLYGAAIQRLVDK